MIAPAGERPWVDPAVVLLLALVAMGVVQTALLGEVRRTAWATTPFALAAVTVVAATVTGRGPTTDRRWLVGLAAAQVVIAATAIVAFVRALPVGLDDPAGFYRVKVLVTTPVGDHNTVAGLLLVGVVATSLLATEDRRWWPAVAVTSFGVVAALSRGAAAVLVVVGAAAFIAGVRRRIAATVLVAGCLTLAAVTGAAVWLGAAPPESAVLSDGPGLFGASVVERLDLARRGVEVGLAEPFLGVGLGGFGDVATDLPPPNEHAHNAVAHLAAEAGVVGAVVAVALPLLLVARAWYLPPGWRRELTLLGGAALVGHAQIDVLAGLWSYEVLLAALLGLAATHRREPDVATSPQRA